MVNMLLKISVTVLLWVSMNYQTMAHPPNAIVHGNSCATCHELAPGDGGLQGGGEERRNALSVISDQELDPDESQGTPPEGWTDRGALKLFTAEPGQTINLTMQVENGATEYAVQLKRLEKEGFSNSGNLLASYVTPDPLWIPQGFDERTYYTNSSDEFDGHDWVVGSTEPVEYSFALTLAANAPSDLYDLEFAVAGIDPATTNGKWYGDEHFYLQVVPEPATNHTWFGMVLFTAFLCRSNRRGRP